MTLPAPGSAPDLALTGGVDVDAVAAVVRGCAGVAGLDGGRFGAGASYLPRRTVPGDRAVDVVIGDIDDPPGAPGMCLPPPPVRGTRPPQPSGRDGEGLTFQSGCES